MICAKTCTNGKEVQKGIYLSFYPGAEIGVIGGNGAGNYATENHGWSQLNRLRVRLGWRRAILASYLPQEPVLDETLDVLGNVRLGVSETQALLDEFEALSMKLGEPMDEDEMMKVLDKQAALQDKIDAVNAWDLDSQLEVAMDALRLPQETPTSPI